MTRTSALLAALDGEFVRFLQKGRDLLELLRAGSRAAGHARYSLQQRTPPKAEPGFVTMEISLRLLLPPLHCQGGLAAQ
jgi:hypothetical protein